MTILKILDISLWTRPDMPVWPGSPRVQLRRAKSFERGDGVNVSERSCDVHTGTHIDAVPEGKYQLVCLRRRLGGAEREPARAILISGPEANPTIP